MSTDWRTKTFWDALKWGAGEHGERTAIVAGEQRLSFADLAARARAMARGMIELGVRPGDNVALWAPDCLEWLIARWAIPAMGATLVPVNTRFRDEEIGFILSQSRATTLIMSAGIATVDYYDILGKVDPDHAGYVRNGWQSEVLPDLKRVIGFGDRIPESVTPFESVEELGSVLGERDSVFETIAGRVAPDDIAQIMYTSGTTSFPKGAQVRHSALLQNNFNTIARMGLGPDDRYLASVSLFSATGTSFTLSPFLAGGAIVLMGDGFDAARFCETVEAEKITMSFYVEPIVRDLRNFASRDRYDLSTLRTGTGAPLRRDSFQWLVDYLGVAHLTNVYGLSETSNAVCRSFWSDPIDVRIETCGLPMPEVRIRIADADTDAELDIDTMGEIQVNAYTVTPGYYNLPEETAASRTADGWLKTGDIGVIRDDGRLMFRGRIKEMIKPGGFNVATLEVENFIKNFPGIREVAVVGVPDDRMGEVAYAFVEVEPGATVDGDAVIQHCRAHIASYKVPRFVDFIDEWPITGSGKIKKLALKDRATRESQTG
ncbi:class I adenylate-forming enzyme family protein [Oceanibacterium hippocampi]|uniref:Long-chain-fatty-acid--CoA ligase n=1 Tax=Oceanibacterium hippocampi TaxID=745714 RepID=A0A1Y5TMR0_9PROT|nr:AMP-binding protein [Oceanibacterium hippocampi]SLN63767.1 Long-chain-fatty-acid--CoA ligase [Oceanibacterium hippocampi]